MTIEGIERHIEWIADGSSEDRKTHRVRGR